MCLDDIDLTVSARSRVTRRVSRNVGRRAATDVVSCHRASAHGLVASGAVQLVHVAQLVHVVHIPDSSHGLLFDARCDGESEITRWPDRSPAPLAHTLGRMQGVAAADHLLQRIEAELDDGLSLELEHARLGVVLVLDHVKPPIQ